MKSIIEETHKYWEEELKRNVIVIIESKRRRLGGIIIMGYVLSVVTPIIISMHYPDYAPANFYWMFIISCIPLCLSIVIYLVLYFKPIKEAKIRAKMDEVRMDFLRDQLSELSDQVREDRTAFEQMDEELKGLILQEDRLQRYWMAIESKTFSPS